ncbi:MAG: DNA-binding response OmpR family regulator [Bacteriovoracaceae bacterium]|jgi:DNA-binding response OmpR family regulator
MSKGKILFIDDEKIISGAVVKSLIKKGYSVEICHSSVEGAKLAEKGEYDLILLDIEMPELSGLDILKRLREKVDKSVLPIIMFTGNEDDKDVVEALKLGANDYLTKPVNTEVLTARIDTQLSLKALSFENAKKGEVETLNALITTYNHEINNPLTIAFGMVEIMKKKKEFSEEKLEKTMNALKRIRDIVLKIKEVSEANDLDFETYIKDSKMLKL